VLRYRRSRRRSSRSRRRRRRRRIYSTILQRDPVRLRLSQGASLSTGVLFQHPCLMQRQSAGRSRSLRGNTEVQRQSQI